LSPGRFVFNLHRHGEQPNAEKLNGVPRHRGSLNWEGAQRSSQAFQSAITGDEVEVN